MSMMSVLRLPIAGLLVVSGLTLGGFTLYGAFDPRPTQASAPVLKPWATTTSPRAVSPGTASSDAKEAKKRKRVEKRAESAPPKAKPPPQQAAAEWPWSWFGN
jgi:hypothetical protein